MYTCVLTIQNLLNMLYIDFTGLLPFHILTFEKSKNQTKYWETLAHKDCAVLQLTVCSLVLMTSKLNFEYIVHTPEYNFVYSLCN